MINKIAVALTALIFLIIALSAFAAFHYYGKSLEQADSIKSLTQQKNEAEFITRSQALTTSIFNTISEAALNEQHANVLDSQTVQKDIKTALAGDDCAITAVPSGANDRLLKRYNAVRQDTDNANSGQPSGSVSAVTATR